MPKRLQNHEQYFSGYELTKYLEFLAKEVVEYLLTKKILRSFDISTFYTLWVLQPDYIDRAYSKCKKNTNLWVLTKTNRETLASLEPENFSSAMWNIAHLRCAKEFYRMLEILAPEFDENLFLEPATDESNGDGSGDGRKFWDLDRLRLQDRPRQKNCWGH